MTLEPPTKKTKIEDEIRGPVEYFQDQPGRIKGLAQIKSEFLVEKAEESKVDTNEEYNDEAEGRPANEGDDKSKSKKGRTKERGQNKKRNLIQAKDKIQLCEKIKLSGDPKSCEFGEQCRFVHDVEMYINSKPEDVDGTCPVFSAIGYCPSGLKCRWLSSHFKDGKMIVNDELKETAAKQNYETNRVTSEYQHYLQKKKFDFTKSDEIIKHLNSTIQRNDEETRYDEETKRENAAAYTEAPFKPEEKKRLKFDRAKILSPLTTVGNLPYRRLMKELGADVTYSEMALAFPLIQGQKAEWALPRAHSSEIGGFGAQIAAPKYWQAIKAAEVISNYCPDTSEINLNCGCPIDLLYRQGAGSALMDNSARMLRMLRGMNAVSNDIPVSVKIRTGTRDKHPTATSLVKRIVDEGQTAAITIHGRSRAQRYTRLADWDYIKEVADTVKEARHQKEEDPDSEGIVKPFIIGNGDTYSWKEWYDNIEHTGVDSVMVARGALIKPWIFEEIDSMQYLDKSASERLDLIKKYAYYGLEHWGADEYGVNQTRRFLCEFLSFTHRYVPVGILEYMPPKINDRPQAFKGRNELETLLSSSDYKDWIKITEMFLGPAGDGFEFTPKHKSNAY